MQYVLVLTPRKDRGIFIQLFTKLKAVVSCPHIQIKQVLNIIQADVFVHQVGESLRPFGIDIKVAQISAFLLRFRHTYIKSNRGSIVKSRTSARWLFRSGNCYLLGKEQMAKNVKELFDLSGKTAI